MIFENLGLGSGDWDWEKVAYDGNGKII